jgi:hypothetical protein
MLVFWMLVILTIKGNSKDRNKIDYYQLSYEFQTFGNLRSISWNNTELERLVKTIFSYDSKGYKYQCPITVAKDTNYFPTNVFSFLPQNLSTNLSFSSACMFVLQSVKADPTPYKELCQSLSFLLDQHLNNAYFSLNLGYLLSGPDFIDFYEMKFNEICTALLDSQYTKCVSDFHGDRNILEVDFWMILLEFQPWICFTSQFNLLFLPEPWRTQAEYVGPAFTTQYDFHKDALYNDGLYYTYPINMYQRYVLKSGITSCIVGVPDLSHSSVL